MTKNLTQSLWEGLFGNPYTATGDMATTDTIALDDAVSGNAGTGVNPQYPSFGIGVSRLRDALFLDVDNRFRFVLI
ncbi:hypothetical protein [Sedimenticola selenatireducens]|uniref:hypothetical protein n=1 Tax=Sedimenticola selenatireducens TaxID=191960 RepID=UPI0021B2AEE1|nr:hypothetical protein [Sedimenticola selenatireducens]